MNDDNKTSVRADFGRNEALGMPRGPAEASQRSAMLGGTAANRIDWDDRIKAATAQKIEAEARRENAYADMAQMERDEQKRETGGSLGLGAYVGNSTATVESNLSDLLASSQPRPSVQEVFDKFTEGRRAQAAGLMASPETAPEPERMFDSVQKRIFGINDVLWDHVTTLEALVQRISPVPEGVDSEAASNHVPNGAYATVHNAMSRTDDLIARLGNAAAFLQNVA